MDRNTITGFILIGLILIGFYIVNEPNPNQLNENQIQKEILAEADNYKDTASLTNNAFVSEENQPPMDSLQREGFYGVFADAAIQKDTINIQSVESDLLKISFSKKGGQISSVELKKYKTHDSLPLILFDGEKENKYGFLFTTSNNRVVNTADLYFRMLPIEKTDSLQKLTMRLDAGENAYLDFVYTIKNDDYMLHFEVVSVGLKNVLSPNFSGMEMYWDGKIRQQEKGREFESRYSGLYYKHLKDDVENLSNSESDKSIIPNRLKWIAFKDQFFSSILIADTDFSSPEIESIVEPEHSKYLKTCSVKMNVPFQSDNGTTGFRFYFGPNHFQTLNSYDKGLTGDEVLDIQKLVPLGWTLFRWINRILVIPMFNFFGSFIGNFGIIILLMTIVIKLILFPFTYKSYISTARMRVLKPEIDKINEKYPADKMAERQKATMELYSKMGVNPMGGCLPMLLQMPILFAMFSFFPASIELRQESFLWAKDLSSYDSILDLPFNIPFYGAHVSLFCLLMTITNLIYTKVNMAATDTGSQQMPGMKTMMYLMPLMFLFFFNNYASGLSYYYFISTVITIAQTYAIRATVDEEKLLKKLHENKKKPAKKSGFMARLEKMQREQLEAQKKQHKK